MENLDYIYKELINKKSTLSVIGLGYVGLPIARAFAENLTVVAYDNSADRIMKLRKQCNDNNLILTDNPIELRQSIFHIIAVPTPVDKACKPDFLPLVDASITLGKNLRKGSVVVYESTVYPSATEEICVPVLEKYSGLKCGKDFFVAYSPARINPSDECHTLKNIAKIVAGMNTHTTDIVKKIYELIVDKMIPVSSIKVAEAVKIVENCQRDVNIAFMNEMSILLKEMGINTKEVFLGMDSKWNALRFRPGLVGGHCIAVDPYYLIDIASKYDIDVPIISEARKRNSRMAYYVGEQIVRRLIDNGKKITYSKVTIYGFTFKENCPDIRNTEVAKLVESLKIWGIKVNVCDYVADPNLVKHVYGLNLVEEDSWDNDVIILAVPHSRYCIWTSETIKKLLKKDEYTMFVDIKGVYNEKLFDDFTEYISL